MNPGISPQRAAVLAVLHRAGNAMRPLDIAAATGMKHQHLHDPAAHAGGWPSFATRLRPMVSKKR